MSTCNSWRIWVFAVAEYSARAISAAAVSTMMSIIAIRKRRMTLITRRPRFLGILPFCDFGGVGSIHVSRVLGSSVFSLCGFVAVGSIWVASVLGSTGFSLDCLLDSIFAVLGGSVKRGSVCGV